MRRKADKYFGDNEAYAGLGRASLRGGVTFVAARGVNMFVQVASTILLARLLTPYDFGLVALVFALTGFAAMLIDLGTSDASIQKTRITHVDVSTLFWLNVTIGSMLTVVLAGGSGFIASCFGEPALTGIALVSSLTFMIAALSAQHYALMRRAMQFRHIAIIEISANVIGSIIGVIMAFTEWGYWALVVKQLATSGLAACGVWMICRWVPGRPRFTPEVKELLGFGVGVTGFGLTDSFARSADRLAIGYFYGAGLLGYYQNAVLLYGNLLYLLAEPLHKVAVSGLSKLRNNVDELRRSWAGALSLTSFVSAPLFAVLAVTGQDFVVILLGPEWAPAGPVLCIFAVGGIANSVERTLGWLHVAAGRSDRWMWWGFFSAACQLVALVAGLPFGLTGVATAYAIVMFGLCVPGVVYAGRPLGIGVRDVLSAVGPQTVAGLSAIAFGFMVQEVFLTDFSRLMRFFVSIAICLAAYLAVVLGVFRVTGPLQLVLSMLRNFGPMRSRGSS